MEIGKLYRLREGLSLASDSHFGAFWEVSTVGMLIEIRHIAEYEEVCLRFLAGEAFYPFVMPKNKLLVQEYWNQWFQPVEGFL